MCDPSFLVCAHLTNGAQLRGTIEAYPILMLSLCFIIVALYQLLSVLQSIDCNPRNRQLQVQKYNRLKCSLGIAVTAAPSCALDVYALAESHTARIPLI